MKNIYFVIFYLILFRFVIVIECIINLGRERKGGREGKEREFNIFLVIKVKLLI